MSGTGGSLLERAAPAPLSPDGGGGRSGGHGLGDDEGGDRGGAPLTQRERGELPLSNARLMLLLALSASTMLFAGLIGAFMVLRGASTQWPPAGSPPLPELFTVNTWVILASSAALAVAHVAQRRGAARTMKVGLIAGTLLAALFLAVQWRCWDELRASGFLPRTNIYGGKLWLLTTLHFAHAAIGLLVLLFVSGKALRGYLLTQLKTPVELASLLWHFIGLVWLTIFVLLHP